MDSASRIKEFVIGMLDRDDTGLNEFEKMIKYENLSKNRKDIQHDIEIAEYLKKNGKESTPIIPLISEMRSPMVLKTIIFGTMN